MAYTVDKTADTARRFVRAPGAPFRGKATGFVQAFRVHDPWKPVRARFRRRTV